MDAQPQLLSPNADIFKGIALFTPGGDLVYSQEPQKQERWHIHLCTELQHLLNLPELPHFLVPGYTATIDRYRDPQSEQIKTIAEMYPAIQRYEALLNAVFGTGYLRWNLTPWQEKYCDPVVLDTYRQQFPQLWENHNLIVKCQQANLTPPPSPLTPSGYVLRLFVSSDHTGTRKILQNLHALLEDTLHAPYTLKLINIYNSPQQAEADLISATPTLVRVLPPPVKKIVGGLEDLEQIISALTMS
jgi:circadian clock protein KaiB